MSSPRIKAELMQFDGVKASADDKAWAVGAIKLLEQLDEAVPRRFCKLELLPDEEAHYGILRTLAAQQSNVRKEQDFRKIVARSNMYSAGELT